MARLARETHRLPHEVADIYDEHPDALGFDLAAWELTAAKPEGKAQGMSEDEYARHQAEMRTWLTR